MTARRTAAIGAVLSCALVWPTLHDARASGSNVFPKGIPPVAGSHLRPAVGATGPVVAYHYVYDRSEDIALGAKGKYVVAAPAITAGDSHSLAEIAVQSADGNQIVEEGWTVDPDQFGDRKPHLFVFHWVDGVPGCYNGCGFVPTSNTVVPGMALTVGSTHTFKITYADSNWVVYDGETEVGYFPGTLWPDGFIEVGLTQWFGEVASASSTPCASMGNGLPASYRAADPITAMKLVSGPAQVGLTPVETDPSMYQGVATSDDSMRFGGPGGCATEPQAVTFTSVPPTNAAVGGKHYRVAAVGGPSGQPVWFAATQHDAAVCVVHGAVVRFIGIGKCTVLAAQPGAGIFLPSPTVKQRIPVKH